MLKRNKDKITKHLVEKNNKLIANTDMHVDIPSEYAASRLHVRGATIMVLCFFPIIVKNDYAVLVSATMVETIPTSTERVKVDGNEFHRYHYKKNGIIINNMNPLANNKLSYSILNHFIFTGRVPWFSSADDLSTLLNGLGHYTNAEVDKHPAIISMMVARIHRLMDIEKEARLYLKNKSEPTQFISLRNKHLNTGSTLTKITSANQAEGMNSAIVSKEKQVNSLEEAILSIPTKS